MKRAILRSSLVNGIMNSSADSKSGGAKEVRNCSDPAPPAIKIAPFWGTDDHIGADDWINLYDSITTDHNYSDKNKLIRLGGHLRKYALAWYVDAVKQCGDNEGFDWMAFKDTFATYFTYNSPIERCSEMSSTVSSEDR